MDVDINYKLQSLSLALNICVYLIPGKRFCTLQVFYQFSICSMRITI